MIDNTSRYANGILGQVFDGHADHATTYVYRQYGTLNQNKTYFLYRIGDFDRLDSLAAFFLNDEKKWYQIMDLNPEISDPFDIPTGTLIRIPDAGFH